MDILEVDVKKGIVAKKKVAIVRNLFLQKKEYIKGTYTWTMNNFFDLDLKPSVLSPTFEVGGYKWYVCFILYSAIDSYKEYVYVIRPFSV